MASTTFWPCETRTSTCRSFATISSGLYRFLAITVLLDVKDIPQVGPLQWGVDHHCAGGEADQAHREADSELHGRLRGHCEGLRWRGGGQTGRSESGGAGRGC